MVRFYFHFRNGDEFVEDEEGLFLADAASARACAITMLRDVLAGDVLAGKLDSAATIEIQNGDHDAVGAVALVDALVIG